MRRRLDAYATPTWQTRALLAHQPIRGLVLEPCVGDGSIARVLTDEAGLKVRTNDIDPAWAADLHLDAAQATVYDADGFDWIVSNPPYKMPICRDMVSLAVRRARVGVAMLLRISFREPTAKVYPRGPWLEDHPPDRALTLPRHSFTGNGKSDSATTGVVDLAERRGAPGDQRSAAALPLSGPPEVCDGERAELTRWWKL